MFMRKEKTVFRGSPEKRLNGSKHNFKRKSHTAAEQDLVDSVGTISNQLKKGFQDRLSRSQGASHLKMSKESSVSSQAAKSSKKSPGLRSLTKLQKQIPVDAKTVGEQKVKSN